MQCAQYHTSETTTFMPQRGCLRVGSDGGEGHPAAVAHAAAYGDKAPTSIRETCSMPTAGCVIGLTLALSWCRVSKTAVEAGNGFTRPIPRTSSSLLGGWLMLACRLADLLAFRNS